MFVPPGRAVKRFWEKKMIARQFRGFTVAACLMVLAAFGMPDTSWAWESDGPRFNIYTQGYEKADVDEGGRSSRYDRAFPADGIKIPDELHSDVAHLSASMTVVGE